MELEKLYEQLSELESKEIFCIDAGIFDKVKDIRKDMIPIKKRINVLEGFVVYPFLNVCDLNVKNSPVCCSHVACETYCTYDDSCCYRFEGEK